MDSKYYITSPGNFVNADELYHWGIKGQKWGIRRYQNPDGSLTAAGRKRYINSDGSLTKAGKKYYAKESERLKEERKRLNNEKRTSAKLAKLDDYRNKNDDIKKQIDPKNAGKQTDTEKVEDQVRKTVKDMSDMELKDAVIRLRNEDSYRDLTKKLGYDGPKTELDAKIADMEKQKKYLELQRDIKGLTAKESAGKKMIKTLYEKVIEPVAIQAGKDYLNKKLGEAGKKTLEKEAKKVEKTVKNSAERVKNKEAKKEAKRAEKENRSRQNNEKPPVYEAEVVGSNYRRKDNRSKHRYSDSVIDVEPSGYLNSSVSNIVTTRNASAGSTWASRYSSTPISQLPASNIYGYLPAPRDDD